MVDSFVAEHPTEVGEGAFRLLNIMHELIATQSHLLIPRPLKQEQLSAEMQISTTRLKAHMRQSGYAERLTDSRQALCILRLPASDENNHTNIALSLYFALHARMPSHVEVMCCSESSSSEDVEDFVRRCRVAPRLREMLHNEETFMFCLLNVESLSPLVLSRLVTFLQRMESGHTLAAGAMPLLLLVSDATAHSLLLRSSFADADASSARPSEQLAGLASAVVQSHLPAFVPNVYVHVSAYAASGKTASVLEHHATDREVLYSCLPCSGSADDLVPLLKLLDEARTSRSFAAAADDDEKREADHIPKVVVHLSVAHDSDDRLLNRLLFDYIVLGVLHNGAHNQFTARSYGDVIALELPSEGPRSILARGASLICASLPRIEPPAAVSLTRYNLIPLSAAPDCLLFSVRSATSEAEVVSLKMVLALQRAKSTGSFKLPSRQEVMNTALPLSGETIFEQIGRFVAVEDGGADDRRREAPTPTSVFRALKFLSCQMNALYKYPLYSNADFLEEPDLVRIYRRLAFYMGLNMVVLSRKYAAAAVRPLASADEAEDMRLLHLDFSFTGWRDDSFMVFYEETDTDSNYVTLSITNKASVLQQMTESDKDAEFQAFMREQNRSSQASITAESLCIGLAQGRDANEMAGLLSDLGHMLSLDSYCGSLVYRALQLRRQFAHFKVDTEFPFLTACESIGERPLQAQETLAKLCAVTGRAVDDEFLVKVETIEKPHAFINKLRMLSHPLPLFFSFLIPY